MTEAGLRIFISYAREDGKQLALRLRDDLRAAGLSPWMDLAEIPGGDNWARTIERAIESCEVGLALCSHKSYHSNFCRAEQMRLSRKGKRIIPILVQKDADIPLTLEHLNYLDFSNPSSYTSSLRDLMSDLNVGRAFAAMAGEETADAPKSLFKPSRTSRLSVPEKRDAPAFRRHLADLRRESWLGGRVWWTYFLYAYADLEAVASTLTSGKFTSANQISKSCTEELVRLYFRPRTPELWAREGIKPMSRRNEHDVHRPVYLLFDLESVICMPEARFSPGDPSIMKKTFATSNAFDELPFEMIYHDGAPKSTEKDEILQSRRAQVQVPGPLTLEALQLIWCRSEAEAETLRALLPDQVRRQWGEQITARADFSLFHRRGAYVETVQLRSHLARITFHVGNGDTGFSLRAEVEDAARQIRTWSEDIELVEPITLKLLPDEAPEQPYTLRLYIDELLAYTGRFVPSDGLI